MVDGAGDVAVGDGVLAGVDLAFDQQRPDQGDRREPGDGDAGDDDAEVPFAPSPSVPRRGDLRAAGSDERPGGEEEDGAQPGDLPEPVEAGRDREDEHRREERRVGLAPHAGRRAPGG